MNGGRKKAHSEVMNEPQVLPVELLDAVIGVEVKLHRVRHQMHVPDVDVVE